MAISETKLQSILQNSFPNAKIKITDTAGDQDHYALEITDYQLESQLDLSSNIPGDSGISTKTTQQGYVAGVSTDNAGASRSAPNILQTWQPEAHV